MSLAESIIKNSKLALTRAKLRSMHSELSYGLSFAPKLQRVGGIHAAFQARTNPPLTRALALIILIDIQNDIVTRTTILILYTTSVHVHVHVDAYNFNYI